MEAGRKVEMSIKANKELVFEWDRSKAQKNITKHKVSFEEAKTVFNDPFLITFPDEYHSENEERLIREFTRNNIPILHRIFVRIQGAIMEEY